MDFGDFQLAYLDYVEGITDEPPAFEELGSLPEQRHAQQWVKSLEDARGVDPYAKRPSTAVLLERIRTEERILERLQAEIKVEDGNTEINELYLEVSFMGRVLWSKGGSRKSVESGAKWQVESLKKALEKLVKGF